MSAPETSYGPPLSKEQFLQRTQANELVTQGNYEEAIGLYKQIVTSETRDPGLLREYAHALTAFGDRDGVVQALGFLKTALDVTPRGNPQDRATIHIATAAAYGRIGELPYALKSYQNALRADNTTQEAQFLLSRDPAATIRDLSVGGNTLLKEGKIHQGSLMKEQAAVLALASAPPAPSQHQ